MKMLWTTLHVKDMDKSLEFYEKILELPVNTIYSPVEGMKIAFLGEGETQLELICTGEDVSFGKDVSIGFEVNSVEAQIEYFGHKGIEIHEGPFSPNPSIEFFYVLDPDGFKVQFVERN